LNAFKTSPVRELPLLQTRAVRKSYRGLIAVNSVDFDLAEGEVHGLVGANGAGKSTLMNILTGAVRADSGAILLGGKEIRLNSPRDGIDCGIAYIRQELATVSKMSVLSNVFLGHPFRKAGLLDMRAMERRFKEISDAFELRIPPRTPAGTLSVANRQKVEIIKAMHAGGRILIMDEPTAALDPADREVLYKLIGRLAAAGSATVFISHDLNEVLKVCNRVSVMRDGALVATGHVQQWTTEGLVAAMLGKARPPRTNVRIERRTDEKIFQAHNIVVPGKVNDVSLFVERGEVLGIAGLVGSGRSELLRAIFGAERHATGEIEINGTRRRLPRSVRGAMAQGIMMVPEDRKLQGLVLDRNGYFNISLGNHVSFSRVGILRTSAMQRRFEQAAGKVKLAVGRLNSEVAKLSGGNQQKVLLTKCLVREPKLLLLDEPSRGVDVAARAEIYSTIGALAARGLGVILVSSDMDEIIENSDRVLVLQAGRCVGVLPRGTANLESVFRLKFSLGEWQA
jgi:ABC-type sugar transport system ATPase subunit